MKMCTKKCFRIPERSFVRQFVRFHVLLLSKFKNSVFLPRSYSFSSHRLIPAEMHRNAW